MRVLAANEPGGTAGGAIAQRTGPVVGVSNMFGSAADSPTTWMNIAAVISTAFPSLPIVGYEHGDHLQGALRSGFEEIGALRVWLHTDRAPARPHVA